jgi:hypothetical protein
VKFNAITKKTTDFLSRPYPLLFAERHSWAYIFGIGILIALLINLQQPYGLHAWDHPYKWLILSGFGWINAAASIVILLVLSNLFPLFFGADNWTVGKEAGLIVFLFIVSGIINWVHAIVTISHFNASSGSFFKMQFYTVAFGCLPVTVLFLFIQNLHLRRKKTVVEEITEVYRPLPEMPEVPEMIPINDELCNIHTILYLKSDGNYVEVHIYVDGKKEMKLCRKTLKQFETILASHSQFIRCKKKYIVNMNKVTGYKGNSEKMTLKLENCTDKVEVSRTFVPAIRKFMGEN